MGSCFCQGLSMASLCPRSCAPGLWKLILGLLEGRGSSDYSMCPKSFISLSTILMFVSILKWGCSVPLLV
jgi:hypothetical protein